MFGTLAIFSIVLITIMGVVLLRGEKIASIKPEIENSSKRLPGHQILNKNESLKVIRERNDTNEVTLNNLETIN